MGTALHDQAVLHDKDQVGVSDSAQSMGDHHNCLLACRDQLVQSLLYLVLTLGVQG